MKVKEIFLNPSNVMDYQEEDVHSYSGNNHLELHMQVNRAIEEALTDKCIDGGAQYAAFLNNIGLEHQSPAGWWNETAVDASNMQLFVDYRNSDLDNEYCQMIESIMNAILSLPKNLSVNLIERHTDIKDYLLNS